MYLVDNYCAFHLLKTGLKKLFSIKSLNFTEYWIFQLHRVAGSIFDNIIRKMMTPGKIFLYILKASLMVHITTKFHDSS